MAQCFRRPAQGNVSRRVRRPGFCSKFVPLLVDDAFATDNDDVLLQIVESFYAFHQVLDIERMFWHEIVVWASGRRPEREIPRMPTHGLDDSDAPMAFRGGPNSF